MPRLALSAAALLVCAATTTAAAEPELRLQGLFCNAEDQLDRVLGLMGRGLDPQRATAAENRDAVVCTYVDRLRFVLRDPVRLAEDHHFVPTVKYEATLIGVVVGDALRPVSPPVRLFFVTPQPIAATLVEQRL
jgi:hypothetical protein